MLVQVHDELLFEAPTDELDQMKVLTKEEMERPVDYNGQMVVFPTNCTTGPSWGELE